MRLDLVALPWAVFDRPSAALGALSAFLETHRPKLEVIQRHEYVTVAAELGFPSYDAIAHQAYAVGEILYCPLIYPELTDSVREYFVNSGEELLGKDFPKTLECLTWDQAFYKIISCLTEQLQQTALSVSGANVVAMTTCFGQLFANIALSRLIKQMDSRVVVILGGSTVSSEVGKSILEEYASIDLIVQGEGEKPLLSCLDALMQDRPPSGPGIVSRKIHKEKATCGEFSELGDLDELPIPGFHAYVEKASTYGIDWILPIEGSRGCWWDRRAQTENPKSACYFCNLNVQWGRYREKTVSRIVSELEQQSEEYNNTRIFFLDNIIRAQGVSELAAGIEGLRCDFDIFYEARANLKPHELMDMWFAGLRCVQFGIEGLSTSFLQRVGKGTSLLQNLQVMKICFELGIVNGANLIIDFPTSTQQEVDDTVRNIHRFAMHLEPCNVQHFHLGRGSTTFTLAEKFGITNLRNSDIFKAGIPKEVWDRIKLLDLSFSLGKDAVSWLPVQEAVSTWKDKFQGFDSPLLYYRQGGGYLKIFDYRTEDPKSIILEGIQADIYLYACQIRSLRDITNYVDVENKVAKEVLSVLVEENLMVQEGNKYLSLATAPDVMSAVRRIKYYKNINHMGDKSVRESKRQNTKHSQISNTELQLHPI